MYPLSVTILDLHVVILTVESSISMLTIIQRNQNLQSNTCVCDVTPQLRISKISATRHRYHSLGFLEGMLLIVCVWIIECVAWTSRAFARGGGEGGRTRCAKRGRQRSWKHRLQFRGNKGLAIGEKAKVICCSNRVGTSDQASMLTRTICRNAF